VAKLSAMQQVEFDASGRDLVRRVFHAVGAEKRHVLDPAASAASRNADTSSAKSMRRREPPGRPTNAVQGRA